MDQSAVEKERDLYLRLLQLGREQEIQRLLPEALALVVEVTAARCGYLQLHDDDDPPDEPRWSISHEFSPDEVTTVRGTISRGIIAAAIATGKTIVTQSALLDERFSGRESVRGAQIEAVLCAPIGRHPPKGVLYLQGRPGRGPFSSEDLGRAEIFADHLVPIIDRVATSQRLRRETDPTQVYRTRLTLDTIVGRSAALADVLKQVSLLAPLDITVLLTGDSGTGKSQLAKAIHDNGPRATQPFVEVNCAALPDSLVEQELFGSVAGAHSTATRAMPGKVAAAERGTLFLDEIGAMPMATQAKLLQVLQSKQYYPLGSAKPHQADVRLIAATNADLKHEVAEHRFREDLFFRLHVLPVRLPSLAERRDDIEELVPHFCLRASERYGVARLTPSRRAIQACRVADWPGNVRELQHAIEAAVIRGAGEGASEIGQQHVFPESRTAEVGVMQQLSFQEATRRFHADLLRGALEESDWNVAETARRLDLARSHLYTLINVLDLKDK